MIKRIPIKGISRDPSGQISAEGMCAESFNVQLDMGEVAPMMKPKPVTDYGSTPINGDILYIHKGIGYEKLICLEGRVLCAYTKGTGERLVLIEYQHDVTISCITSIGNTVLVSDDEGIRYFLYKSNGYIYLGDKIPIPNIWFGERISVSGGSHSGELGPRADADASYPTYIASEHSWVSDTGKVVVVTDNQFFTDWSHPATNYRVDDADKLEFVSALWSGVDGDLNDALNYGGAVFPMFVRYAVRLYDDSMYACSTPVLLGADVQRMIFGKLLAVRSTEQQGGWDVYGNVGTPKPYNILMDFSDSNLETIYEGWSDIVKGIDIFLSAPIIPARFRNSIQLTNFDYEYSGPSSQSPYVEKVKADIIFDPNCDQGENVADYLSTFSVKEILFSSFHEHTGIEQLNDVELSADWIMNRDPMKETPGSSHKNFGGLLFKYNNRLLLTGSKILLSYGNAYIHSARWEPGLASERYVFNYYIRGNNGESIVVSRGVDGTKFITPRESALVVETPQNQYYEVPSAWIAYPDSRCYQVVIQKIPLIGDASQVTIPMKASQLSDVSYAFIGFGEDFSFPDEETTITEDNVYPYDNAVLVSPVNNPFIFPQSDILQLSVNHIWAVEAVTMPISEGQVGEFPLYLFTDEGVFIVSVGSAGELVSTDIISREILLNRNSIVAIEQSIFFVSARGLLLLTGRSVTRVSEFMDGRPESLSSEFKSYIESNYLDGVLVSDAGPIYQFLDGCSMTYDYANSRIILFREGHPQMYVYKFDTQSWHRTSWGQSSTPVRAINSYPEAFVVEENELGYQSLMNYSVFADEPNAVPLPGIIYTRELSLDQQDIYKTINRLKIRGRYADGHVKWALQGSNDGINYRTLHSLRGPSWKWYRIAIVTMLDAQERISYIELDYTPKFTDRLR